MWISGVVIVERDERDADVVTALHYVRLRYVQDLLLLKNHYVASVQKTEDRREQHKAATQIRRS